MTVMIRRAAAAQACIDQFLNQPYQPGKCDCIRLAGFAARELERSVGLIDELRYRTEAGGLKAMLKLGFKSLVEAVDAAGLERIAPAAALPGDIIALPSEPNDPFGCALTVAVGNGRVLGFQHGVGAVLQPLDFVAAWRV